MRRRAAASFALAPLIFLASCRVVGNVLWTVDSGLPDEGVAPGIADAASVTFENDAGQAFADVRTEQDTGAPNDAELEVETAILGGDSELGMADDSDGGDAFSCDVCSGGMTCQNGECACPPGLLSCGGTCVDEQTDNGNCGACAVVCSTGLSTDAAVCTAGRCLATLGGGTEGPEGMAVAGANVYWTCGWSGGGSPVMMVSTSGSGQTTLAMAAQETIPTQIAVEGSNVYWAETQANGGPPGYVMQTSTGGGTATVLASGAPCSVAVDATSIYWMDGCTAFDGGNPIGSVMKEPIGGGAATTLASGQTLPASAAYAPIGFAVDATSVYWTTSDSVLKVSTGGGTVITLASGQTFPGWSTALAVDATSVYWTTSDSVMKVSTAGGAPSALASGQSFYAAGQQLAVDGTSAYWLSGGSVIKVSAAGGTPTVLVSGQQMAAASGAIAVDATSVYFTNVPTVSGDPDFSVMRLTPK